MSPTTTTNITPLPWPAAELPSELSWNASGSGYVTSGPDSSATFHLRRPLYTAASSSSSCCSCASSLADANEDEDDGSVTVAEYYEDYLVGSCEEPVTASNDGDLVPVLSPTITPPSSNEDEGKGEGDGGAFLDGYEDIPVGSYTEPLNTDDAFPGAPALITASMFSTTATPDNSDPTTADMTPDERRQLVDDLVDKVGRLIGVMESMLQMFQAIRLPD
ncbi:hypothetical protein EX30DRAFT_398975 [Ascodesmis nigricans]|uniref:Uncharacterized protein n=1 Tax=Ascodesmis nigricans TaxID=341454 RepID=A0A4S2MJ28_9PEZI|nr:hypothetical protein EX30DRAFT_398975 [Ascodesmis nigricans]